MSKTNTLFLISFTRQGAQLGQRLSASLSERYHCTSFTMARYAQETNAYAWEGTLLEWTKQAFEQSSNLVFLSACGIAVRAIAPFLKDKRTDPAVVVVDEGGNYAISLLSGHFGGANWLAQRIAAETGGQAVVTTATDVRNLFAVDVWAVQNRLFFDNKQAAKQISAALLDGEKVGFSCEFPIEGNLPDDLVLDMEKKPQKGIRVSWNVKESPFPTTLSLVPYGLVLGIGCRKSTKETDISLFIEDVLREKGIPLESVEKVCTIDLKKEEPGLQACCKKHGWNLEVFSAQQLKEAQGEFTHSDFVAQTTGVDNVCERAAVLGCGGKLVLKKKKGNGITIAAAWKERTLYFNKEEGQDKE